MRSLILNNGVEIPQVGFGTAAIGEWQQDDDYVKDVILGAIKTGYRHIDTASLYGNERSVGKAIKESGLPREDFFVVSKVWDNEQGRENTLAAFNKSMDRLQLDYLDLYLVHWPVPELTQETWQVMEKLYSDKRIRALGLSNFRKSDIEQILTFAEVMPTYNQLELHPYLTQEPLCAYCADKDIAVSCWSPLGSGTWSRVAVAEKPVSDGVISEIAQKHGVSNGQVILKWDVQQNRIVIPKAESPENIANNLKLYDFELTAKEIERINSLNKDRRFGANPDTAYADNMAMRVPE